MWEYSKLSSEWLNLRKRIWGRGESTEKNIIEHLWRKALRDSPEEQRLNFAKVYQIICDSPKTAIASDFHIVLGGDVYILYTCPQCHIAPVHPVNWLRCTGLANQDVPGSTKAGGGKWHCSATGCLTRWYWKTGGNKRILLLPEHNDTSGGFDDLKMVVIGKPTRQEEHTITLLKTAELVTKVKVGGREMSLGTKALIKALDKLNSEADKRIMNSSLPKIKIRAATKEEMKTKGLLPYREHPSLSLSQPGVTYNALQTLENTPVISAEDRQSVLDALVCFYSFEKKQTKEQRPEDGCMGGGH